VITRLETYRNRCFAKHSVDVASRISLPDCIDPVLLRLRDPLRDSFPEDSL
jgi:hypothetical protein